jgi:hypothetical protein
MLVPRTLSVVTTSAAMGKQHTLGITLSDSSGPLGLASSSPQFCIVLLVALARGMKLPTVLEGGTFLAESEVRALRAQGAEDPSSMVNERSMRERDVTGRSLGGLPKTRAKPARNGEDFGGLRFRARSDHALEAKQWRIIASMIGPYLRHNRH